MPRDTEPDYEHERYKEMSIMMEKFDMQQSLGIQPKLSLLEAAYHLLHEALRNANTP